jgi:hypothetical protein
VVASELWSASRLTTRFYAIMEMNSTIIFKENQFAFLNHINNKSNNEARNYLRRPDNVCSDDKNVDGAIGNC